LEVVKIKLETVKMKKKNKKDGGLGIAVRRFAFSRHVPELSLLCGSGHKVLEE
jgi:hypothetical protein